MIMILPNGTKAKQRAKGRKRNKKEAHVISKWRSAQQTIRIWFDFFFLSFWINYLLICYDFHFLLFHLEAIAVATVGWCFLYVGFESICKRIAKTTIFAIWIPDQSVCTVHKFFSNVFIVHLVNMYQLMERFVWEHVSVCDVHFELHLKHMNVFVIFYFSYRQAAFAMRSIFKWNWSGVNLKSIFKRSFFVSFIFIISIKTICLKIMINHQMISHDFICAFGAKFVAKGSNVHTVCATFKLKLILMDNNAKSIYLMKTKRWFKCQITHLNWPSTAQKRTRFKFWWWWLRNSKFGSCICHAELVICNSSSTFFIVCCSSALSISIPLFWSLFYSRHLLFSFVRPAFIVWRSTRNCFINSIKASWMRISKKFWWNPFRRSI